MKTRFPPIGIDDLTADQQALEEQAGSKVGPYPAYQRSPGLWHAMQPPRSYFGDCAIPAKLRELAIVTAARFWNAEFVFQSHAAIARHAGLGEHILAALSAGNDVPVAGAQEAVYRFCRSLLSGGRVSDAEFAAVRAEFGERGAVDLTAIVGYYSYVCLLLNLDCRTDEAEAAQGEAA